MKDGEMEGFGKFIIWTLVLVIGILGVIKVYKTITGAA